MTYDPTTAERIIHEYHLSPTMHIVWKHRGEIPDLYNQPTYYRLPKQALTREEQERVAEHKGEFFTVGLTEFVSL